MCPEQASSYLLRAGCGAFQGGTFKGATRALGVHVEDSEFKSKLIKKGSSATGDRSGFSSSVSIRNRQKPLDTHYRTEA